MGEARSPTRSAPPCRLPGEPEGSHAPLHSYGRRRPVDRGTLRRRARRTSRHGGAVDRPARRQGRGGDRQHAVHHRRRVDGRRAHQRTDHHAHRPGLRSHDRHRHGPLDRRRPERHRRRRSTTPSSRASPTTSATATKESYAGPLAKAATFARVAKGNPTSYGGINLITRLEERTADVPADPTKEPQAAAFAGRIFDKSEFGNYANVVGQSYAVRALTLARSTEAAAARDFLLKQQCASGYFRAELRQGQRAQPVVHRGRRRQRGRPGRHRARGDQPGRVGRQDARPSRRRSTRPAPGSPTGSGGAGRSAPRRRSARSTPTPPPSVATPSVC